MLYKPGSVRLVVVRADYEHPVRPGVLRCLSQPHCFGSIIGAGTCNHGNLTIDPINGDFNNLLMFFEREGRRFTS